MSLLSIGEVALWVPLAAGNDTLITAAIARAQGLADAYCRRSLEAAERTETFDIEPAMNCLPLGTWPIDTTEDLIVVEAGVTLQSTNYELDAVNGLLHRKDSYWYRDQRAVTVTYTGGYTETTCPGGLKEALLRLVAWIIGTRGNVGAKQESQDGYSVTYEDMDGPVPASVGQMLQPFKRVSI